MIETRLKKLLRRGYFPAELPPPFTTDSFADNAAAFAAKWEGAAIRKFWTAPEVYSIPRYGDIRRKLSLVNPVNQLHVAHLISTNWSDIKTKLARSTVTEFKPEFAANSTGRAITGVDFDGVARQRARLLATYGRYVKTDIARFYPSIYTHSIAWAIVGKAHAKANHSTKAFKDSYANHLDKAVGAGQEGQTIGIPIGPDTSRIISELIVVEVEENVKINIPSFESRSLRYVDDILIGLEENETASAVLSGLSLALYDYQLELNAEKTSTLGLGCNHSPEWIHYVRTFELSPKASRQRDDLDSFFEQAVYLADQNKRDNALLFAVKRAASFAVDATNTDHLVRWMLYCARRSATCLSFVAEHLAAINATSKLPLAEIHTYILQQIPIKAAAGHTDELAWLLFWAREIKLIVPASVMANVMNLRSSTVGLLTLDLWHSSLINGPLDFSFWQGFATESGLKSEMWLIAYEATRKGWWPKTQNDDFITKHSFFADLWASKVEFYDSGKKARERVTPSALTKSFAEGSGFGFPEYPM
ncbi:Reverse transcriptase (RNA-dependent DNA polymerase) [Novosphingobium panipatense]|uniref:Reverse transcriptase (RNA-dependent DNA polymerase) n=2 Tax=Novosphingobium panipatense TaxID=428991 RepID=A0ABY1PZJ4_9SPHN|nr:Reverse transcriptase (RNA-dependent DNA polymerase) [Novosphingobium panipatense]